MKDWTELVGFITVPGALAGVVLGFFFFVSSCEIRSQEEKTKQRVEATQQHEATESLKAKLAEQGYDAQSIRCIAEPKANDLLCVKLQPQQATE